MSDCEELVGSITGDDGVGLVVVPKQDLKLPVRSSETTATREGPIGMLIVSGVCRIVSQSDIRVRIVVTIPCHHRLGSGQVMDLHTSVILTSGVSIVKVVFAVISTYIVLGPCAIAPRPDFKPARRR